jgi:hypothetical protein
VGDAPDGYARMVGEEDAGMFARSERLISVGIVFIIMLRKWDLEVGEIWVDVNK